MGLRSRVRFIVVHMNLSIWHL